MSKASIGDCSSKCSYWRGIAAVLVLGIAGAGCSADITRFDAPFYGFGGDEKRTTVRDQAVLPPRGLVESEPAPIPSGQRTAYAAPQAQPVESVPLRDVAPRRGYESVSPGIARRKPDPILDFNATKAPSSVLPRSAVPESRTVKVEAGDTLYGIARRHGTTIAALSEANGISGSVIKPGQELVLPVGAASVAERGNVRKPAPEPVREATAVPTDWRGSYTIRAGDSLYMVARNQGVSVAELKRVNGISDPRRLRPGTVIKVPEKRVAQAAPAVRGAAKTATDAPSEPIFRPVTGAGTKPSEPRKVGIAPRAPSGSEPMVLNGGGSEAAPVEKTSAGSGLVEKAAKPTGGKLKWPVIGHVVAPFGKRKDGTHNDGIDIAVPKGTDVRAAGDGVVAYAGSEVKGFGNLLLVRHEDGKVTAYAHNDALLVQRGDRVRRGQVIAKSGDSGGVDQPLLHFEVRTGSKPVDPVLHMEAL